jgi:hypothetical protein
VYLATRQQVIANVLRQRYVEVCQAASQTGAHVIGETNNFVLRVHKQLAAALPPAQHLSRWNPPESWFVSRYDCLEAIRELATDGQLESSVVQPPEESAFFGNLSRSLRQPERRFELLTTRYLHPLNIAAPTEERIREHLLERLMVADRGRIEQQGLGRINVDDLLLKLNLIAIYGSLTNDLRYLDSLNYYHELLPASWYPDSAHNWLRISFLAFYVRALAVHFNRLN